MDALVFETRNLLSFKANINLEPIDFCTLDSDVLGLAVREDVLILWHITPLGQVDPEVEAAVHKGIIEGVVIHVLAMEEWLGGVVVPPLA